MPSDTFAAGRDAAAQAVIDHGRACNEAGKEARFSDIVPVIRRLTPIASEATAIGAGEGLSARALHWRLMGLAASLRSDQFDEDDASARDIEEAARRLAAASPKVASDTAPGVEHARNIADGMVEACATLAVSTKYDAEDRQRWKACHDDAAAISAALAASPTASDTDTAIPGGECTCGSPYFDLGAHVSTCPSLAAASPKPDTDTPVDPGVEGVRTSAALALMYLQTGFIACDACGREMPTKDLDATSELSEALATKPIAGMNAGKS